MSKELLTQSCWNGDRRQAFSPDSGDLANFEFSHDHQFLLTTSDREKAITLWDLNGNELSTFQGHGDWVTDVGFSPDMQRLASISFDGQLDIWQKNCLIHAIDSKVMQVFEAGDRLIMHQIDGLDDWEDVIKKGCDWLGNYLTSSTDPEVKDAQKLCETYGDMTAAK